MHILPVHVFVSGEKFIFCSNAHMSLREIYFFCLNAPMNFWHYVRKKINFSPRNLFFAQMLDDRKVAPCRALFYQGAPIISLPGPIWGSNLGSIKVQEGPLSLGRVGQGPNKCSNMVRRAREYMKYKFPNFLKNPDIFLRNPFKGPCMVHWRTKAGLGPSGGMVLCP